jgi:hypothetical protein
VRPVGLVCPVVRLVLPRRTPGTSPTPRPARRPRRRDATGARARPCRLRRVPRERPVRGRAIRLRRRAPERRVRRRAVTYPRRWCRRSDRRGREPLPPTGTVAPAAMGAMAAMVARAFLVPLAGQVCRSRRVPRTRLGLLAVPVCRSRRVPLARRVATVPRLVPVRRSLPVLPVLLVGLRPAVSITPPRCSPAPGGWARVDPSLPSLRSRRGLLARPVFREPRVGTVRRIRPVLRRCPVRPLRPVRPVRLSRRVPPECPGGRGPCITRRPCWPRPPWAAPACLRRRRPPAHHPSRRESRAPLACPVRRRCRTAACRVRCRPAHRPA